MDMIFKVVIRFFNFDSCVRLASSVGECRGFNFLDVQFNLNNGTYQPYRKPENTPVYINKKSNHPPVVLKQLPKSIAKRISDFSSDEIIFCNSIPIYSEALKKKWF